MNFSFVSNAMEHAIIFDYFFNFSIERFPHIYPFDLIAFTTLFLFNSIKINAEASVPD